MSGARQCHCHCAEFPVEFGSDQLVLDRLWELEGEVVLTADIQHQVILRGYKRGREII